MDAEKIGKMVRFHRKKSGLTQEGLALLGGLGKSAVFDIEKGKISVQLDTLLKVLKVLNITLDFQGPLMASFKEKLIRKANVFVNDKPAGVLHELERGKRYLFTYLNDYKGPSVSLEMPLSKESYDFDRFPPFFEGLLPEGLMLDGLLRQAKLDANDLLGQLITVGKNLVGNVTVKAAEY